MYLRTQVLGLKWHGYSWVQTMNVISLNDHVRSFPIDMLRYINGWISNQDDVSLLLSYLSGEDRPVPTSIQVSRYADSKLLTPVNWGLGRWDSFGWRPLIASYSSLRLKKKHLYNHLAVLSPGAKDTALPFELISKESAFNVLEGHSSYISNLLCSQIDPKDCPPIVLSKYHTDKISKNVWRFDEWDETGWDFQPIPNKDLYNYTN